LHGLTTIILTCASFIAAPRPTVELDTAVMSSVHMQDVAEDAKTNLARPHALTSDPSQTDLVIPGPTTSRPPTPLSNIGSGISGDTVASSTPTTPLTMQHSASSSDDSGSAHRIKATAATRAHSPWLQPRPLLGLFALLLAATCALFSLAVLLASKDQPVSRWPVQPTVYLAIASAVSNTAIGFAHTQAVPIAWWYEATKGSTLERLELQWRASFLVSHAVRSAHRTTVISAATLLVALMIIDGPLLQRASSVVVATQSKAMSLSTLLTPELPTGFSGQILPERNIETDWAAVMTGDQWMRNTPIILPSSPACGGTCVAKLNAPGMTKGACNQTTWPITPKMWHSANATWGDDANFGLGANPILGARLKVYTGPDETALQNYTTEATKLYTGTINISEASGSYVATMCYMLPAILEHEVTFDASGQVTLPADTYTTSRVLALTNNTSSVGDLTTDHPMPDTIDYFTMFVGPFVGINNSAVPPDEGEPYWNSDDTSFNAQTMKYYNFFLGGDNMQTFDPTADIFQTFNELMFRAAVSTSSWANITQLIDLGLGLSINQSVIANQTVIRNVFRSDFRWYTGATALEIVVVLMVLPLYWGWWTLERHLTLSPLSTAAAFNAPLLHAVPANGVDDLVGELGKVRVRYLAAVVGGEDEKHPNCDLERGESVGHPAGFVVCNKSS
jgi:hypothetical protein